MPTEAVTDLPDPVLKNVSKAEPAQEQPEETDLWQLTRDNFGLDLSRQHPRIEKQLRWYAKHPKYLSRIHSRMQRYYPYILNEVLKRDMPSEIALLPIVESAYDPFAYSHGRAAGPWQFIPSTGKHFGLKKTWWYDGRRDIVASTEAALTYLQQLHKRFGSWELALAAYNAGGGTVNRAIRKNRANGKSTDYFSLRLPKETQAYVPKLIAMARLVQSPQKYAITLKPLPNKPYFRIVETGGQLDLAQAADMAGTTTKEIYLLNPGFNRWATDPAGPHYLSIPAASHDKFQASLAKLPANNRINWSRYKIQPGDSLITIARRHHTTVDVIRKTNNINGNRIRSGKTLLLPTASKRSSEYVLSESQRLISKHKRNQKKGSKQKVVHKVRSGDSFWTIAKNYKVGVRQLASWNNMAPGDPLAVGKSLVIWKKGKGDGGIIRRVGYKVRSGDSLARIAGKFNVSVKNILNWNGLDAKKYLQPGQSLTLYVDVTKAN
ncbi:lytic transglycosylase [Marinobacterium jannaschii]|uniref:lytic transglycosylase n=1 Tax=Marinobacterium jannaschii TaxID=64970 RepID=UPI001FE0FE8F|nr:LysM peptidoglycan-binding domain-containing protein [Marinobacterium jannaschii]